MQIYWSQEEQNKLKLHLPKFSISCEPKYSIFAKISFPELPFRYKSKGGSNTWAQTMRLNLHISCTVISLSGDSLCVIQRSIISKMRVKRFSRKIFKFLNIFFKMPQAY